MQTFFKFIGEDGYSLSRSTGGLHYVPGKYLNVPNANPNKKIQCSSGIHCLLMDSDKPISSTAVIFGPKIAILEAEDDDIIYYSQDGKCRLKKCQVLEVMETKDLDIDLILGRGDDFFFSNTSHYVTGVSNKYLLKIIRNKYFRGEFCYLNSFLTDNELKYNKEVEKTLLDKNYNNLAVNYALYHRKYSDNRLVDIVCDLPIGFKISWSKSFGPSIKIEDTLNSSESVSQYIREVRSTPKLLDKMLECDNAYVIYKFSCFNDSAKIRDYMFNRVTGKDLIYSLMYCNDHEDDVTAEEIESVTRKVIDYAGQPTTFWTDYSLTTFIENFYKHPSIRELALKSPQAACKYSTVASDYSDDLMSVIAKDAHYSTQWAQENGFHKLILEHLVYNGKNVFSLFRKFGINEELLDMFCAKTYNYYSVSLSLEDILFVIENLSKYPKLENILLVCRIPFAQLYLYCKEIGKVSDDVKEYVKQRYKDYPSYFNVYSLSDIVNKFGYDDCALEFYKTLEPFYEMSVSHIKEQVSRQLTNIKEAANRQTYYKVVRVRANNAKMSALIHSKSKNRKSYYSNGVTRNVDRGMVFSNIFSAVKFVNIYGKTHKANSRDPLVIMSCHGDNFKPASVTFHYRYLHELDKRSIQKLQEEKSSPEVIAAICREKGLDYRDVAYIELPGSGWLDNIEVFHIIYN